MIIRIAIFILLGLTFACASGPVDPGDGGDDLTTGDGDPEPDNFGTIRIEVAPLAGDDSMYAQTAEVVATVHYETCLQDFYFERQPTYQQVGPDGAPVFEDWAGRLCSDFEDSPDCEIVSINQTLIPENDIYTLSVTYEIEDPSTIAYRNFHVGPLPLEEFAGCDENQRPRVELLQSGLLGFDAQGNMIWRISVLPASNVAVANQGAPLRVETIANP